MNAQLPLTRSRYLLLVMVGFLLVWGVYALSNGVLSPEQKSSRHLNCIGMTPLPNEPFEGRLVMFFDRTLQAPKSDKEIQKLLTWRPALDGEVTIEQNFILFTSSDKRLDTNNIFQVEINHSLRSADGRRINPRQTKFTLCSFIFEPSFWIDGESNSRMMAIGVRFPTQVDNTHLKDHLEIESPLPNCRIQKVESLEDNRIFRITLNQNENTSFTLIMKAGLQDKMGLLETKKEYSFSHEAFRKTEPAIVEASPSRNTRPLDIEYLRVYQAGRNGARVYLETTWDIEATELSSHLKIEPEVKNIRITREYSNEFSIYGDWRSEKLYQITLLPGIKNSSSNKSDAPVERYISIPVISEYMGFADEGKYYFPRNKDAFLTIECRNVRNSTLQIHRLFPSNIAAALGDMRNGKAGSTFKDNWCEEMGEFNFDLPIQPDILIKKTFTFSEILPQDKKGVFYAELSSGGTSDYDYWDYYYYSSSNNSRLILATDIGVLCHWEKKNLALFAHNLYTLQPLPRASVHIYSSKSQILANGATNDSGILELKDFKENLGEPALVVVEYQDDYTFLELSPRTEDTNDLPNDLPLYKPGEYEAFIYGDRSLFRPGDMVHLSWIVRKNFGESMGSMPLMFRVLKPNGKPLFEKSVMLSDWGAGGEEFETRKINPTGLYRAQLLLPGQDLVLGEYAFRLEEFVPNRLKADIRTSQFQWSVNKQNSFHIKASHFTGAPASGRKCEGYIRLEPEQQPFKNWAGYIFSNDSTPDLNTIPCGEQILNENGETTYTIKIASHPKWTFPLKGKIIGRVFEMGGRPIGCKTDIALFPADICIGMALPPQNGKKSLDVSVAAVHPDGSPADIQSVQVTVEKQSYDYYVRRYYSYNEANWTPTYSVMETKEAAIKDGRGTISFDLPDYGYYRIRVHSPQTNQYSSLKIYSDGETYTATNAANPELITIITEKESYAIGEKAQIRIETSFDGWGVVAVQGSSIHKFIPVEIKNKVGMISLDMTEEFFPNIWLEATVIHRIDKSHAQVFPFSSFTRRMLRVENPRKKLQIDLAAPAKEILPEQKAAFDILVRDSAGNPMEAELTLAAVDEGIHAIVDYKSPQPYEWLLRARRPDLRRAHYYDRIVYDFEKPDPAGDASLDDIANRMGLSESNWIKTVALWNGTVKTNSEGRARVEFSIPDFSGKLRLVAVGVSKEALGSQTSFVIVKRPCDFDFSLPRFMMPNDIAACSAILYNHTDSPVKANIQWETSGALQTNKSAQSLTIPANRDAIVSVPINAGAINGEGRIDWSIQFTGAHLQRTETINKKTDLPVHFPAAFQTRHELKILKSGEKWTLTNDDFIKKPEVRVSMTVGASPFLRLRKALQFVVDYPYGCVEQTTSQLMPLYILRHEEALTSSVLRNHPPLDVYIRSGIDRLFSMQTSSGGLSFWPGYSDPNYYGSIYALHFLTLIKRDASFDLPTSGFDSLQKFVRDFAADSKNSSSEFLYLRAYAIFVLALNDDPKAMELIERFENAKLPKPARHLLAAALSLQSPDSARVKMFLAAPSEPYQITPDNPTFASEIRDKAMELLAMTKMSVEPSLKAQKAQELIRFLEGYSYSTTQEMAFIATALGEYFKAVESDIREASAEIEYTGGFRKINGRETFQNQWQDSDFKCAVRNNGRADIYINIIREGIPSKPENTQVSNGISIKRVTYTQEGRVNSEPVFKQGKCYIICWEIQCPSKVKNLIVADLLPAGFEIENPRLDTSSIPQAKLAAPVVPSHFEIRDDRTVAAFDELVKGAHKYYYIVRAVTPGKYVHPPLQADCMYNPSIRASIPASAIEVKE